MCITCLHAGAQTAHFSSATSILGSGFSAPFGVAVDGNGNVFVADTANSVVKEIMAVGGYTTVNTIGGGFRFPQGVAVDGSGNVFVGDYSNNAVKEILAAGGYTTVNTLGSGFSAPYGVAVDGSGNVFVADAGNNAVKEILAAGGYTTVNTLGSGFASPTGVAVDGNGNVFVADADNNAVKEILAAGGYTTVNTLGSGFSLPFDVAVDGSGNVFVADYGNTAVKEILAAGGYTTVNTLGSGFSYPGGVTVDGSGNVFVADSGSSSVKEIAKAGANFGPVNVGSTGSNFITLLFTFDAAGTLGSTPYNVLTQGAPNLDFNAAATQPSTVCVTGHTYNLGDTCTVNLTFKPTAPGTRYGAAELLGSAGNLLATGYAQGTGVGPQVTFANTTSGVYLPGTQSTLGSGFYPEGVAVDGSGNVFVADYGNGALKEIVAAGGYATIKTLGNGIWNPIAVAVDGSGNLFVADFYNSEVKEVLAAGGYTAVNILASGFNIPTGVAVDGSGNVFVSDTGNSQVKEIVAAGGYTTVKNLGSGFYYPTGVAVDGSGNVFVADDSNSEVKEIVAAGGYTTINTLGSGFYYPYSVSLDGSGNVLVTETYSNAVKEIVAAGGYTTIKILGSGFNRPRGVAVDGSGNVFVVDNGNSRVEKLDYADPPSLSFAATAMGSTSTDSPQMVTLANIGNAALSFPAPVSGNNPSITANFSLDSGGASTCLLVTSGSGAGTLAAGASCLLPISFTPTTTGSLSGALGLTDNALNAAAPGYATQSIPLSGTGMGVPAMLISPTQGAQFGSSSQSFTWSAGSGVTRYDLWLGSTGVGSHNLYYPAQTTSLQTTVTGLPTNGVTIYARLNSLINGAWQSIDYQYTAFGATAPAALLTPAPVSTPPYTQFVGSSQSFTWTAGSGVTAYDLWLGTGGAGSHNLYYPPSTTLQGVTVSGLPTGGVTIYARLNSLINGAWQSIDYQYTAFGTAAPAVLLTPVPVSTPPYTQFAGSSQIFTWSSGSGVTQYDLWLGTTGVGSHNLYYTPTTSGTQVTVGGLPTNGVTIYARLNSLINGAWQSIDYTYTAFGTTSPAVLQTPTPGTTLGGSSQTFTWLAGSGVAAYDLWVGTTGVGSHNLYYPAQTTLLQATVNGLPTNGATVYVRLNSLINGVWQSIDYTYTAQ